MNVNKLLGLCLIIFGVINVLHEIFARSRGLRQPGIAYAVFTALLFTAGAAFLWRGKIIQKN